MSRLPLLLAVALLLAGCGGGSATPKPAAASNKPLVRLGTKNFPEQYVLGELYAQALRARGFNVEVKEDIGASEIIHRALTGGAIDMYPEYIGVLTTDVAHHTETPQNAEAAYRLGRQFERKRGFELLHMTPFSNTDALAVKPGFARRRGLHTIGDLGKLPGRVLISGPPEFRTRFEGLVGLERVYHLGNLDFKPLQIGAQYAALDSGRVDVANVFTTDGQLSSGRYTVLSDPKRVFGFQNVAPIVSRRVLDEQGPEFRATIDRVSAKLTTVAMRRMNAAVMLRHESPAAVARNFLRAEKLVGG